MTFIPNHIEIAPLDGPGTRTVVIIHGILGSAKNWRSFARSLRPGMPDARFILVDMRHHGESHGAPGPDTLDACAADVTALLEELELTPDIVVGHSFGGKVALRVSRQAQYPPKVTWVVDSPPSSREVSGDVSPGEIERVFEALRGVKMPAHSRQAVQEALVDSGMSAGVAAWMTTNVIRSERGDYVWRFDLSGVERLIADYFERDDWGLVSRWPEGAELHFIVAGRGGRFTDAEVARLQSLAHVQTTVFAESGHWVHVDAPELLRAHLISS